MQITIEINNHNMDNNIEIGDSVLRAIIDPNTSVTTSSPLLIGTIVDITPTYITVETSPNFALIDIVDMQYTTNFIMFSKPISVNKSSVQGYYADVTLKNSSNKYAELFAISSEVTPSSK